MIEIWLNGNKVSTLTLATWGKDPAVGQTYTLGQTYAVSGVAKDPKSKFLKVTLGARPEQAAGPARDAPRLRAG